MVKNRFNEIFSELKKETNKPKSSDWRDYVEEFKNWNAIYSEKDIPEMYQGYPGIIPGTIARTMRIDPNTGIITALRVHPIFNRIMEYIVNANDLYDDKNKEKRLKNSRKLYEIFMKKEEEK